MEYLILRTDDLTWFSTSGKGGLHPLRRFRDGFSTFTANPDIVDRHLSREQAERVIANIRKVWPREWRLQIVEIPV